MWQKLPVSFFGTIRTSLQATLCKHFLHQFVELTLLKRSLMVWSSLDDTELRQSAGRTMMQYLLIGFDNYHSTINDGFAIDSDWPVSEKTTVVLFLIWH